MDLSSSASVAQFRWSFLHPKYWGIWIGSGLLFMLTYLPWTVQRMLAHALGRFAWAVLKSRRKTTIKNLSLCFPEWTPVYCEQQGKQVFIEMMLGVFETLRAWYRPRWFVGRSQIAGLEHLQHAQQQGDGVILLGSHSTMLDAGGYICSQYFKPDVVYRPQNNLLLDWLIKRSRGLIYQAQIDHHDIRTLVKRLKSGAIVWYSPDQDFGLKQGVMAPFFGVPAATLTAQRRLIHMTHAKLLAVHFYRVEEKNPRYQITIEPEITHYPTTDEVADATRINQLLESQLSRAPTQWMWFHRRFKTRPEGQSSLYEG